MNNHGFAIEKLNLIRYPIKGIESSIRVTSEMPDELQEYPIKGIERKGVKEAE